MQHAERLLDDRRLLERLGTQFQPEIVEALCELVDGGELAVVPLRDAPVAS